MVDALGLIDRDDGRLVEDGHELLRDLDGAFVGAAVLVRASGIALEIRLLWLVSVLLSMSVLELHLKSQLFLTQAQVLPLLAHVQ